MNDIREGASGSSENSAADFGLDAVRELLQLIGQTDITEILIERGDVKLHVKRGHLAAPQGISAVPVPVAQPSIVPMPVSVPPTRPVATPSFNETADHHIELPAGYTVVAPMVGTFYAAPSPKDPPFVQEGDEVHAGDTVGIIEAMKMMNEIECDVAGRVARILVKNGQPVEYGQPIMVIEPL